MSQKDIVVRSKWDRLRYTLVFEALLLALFTPVLSYVFEKSPLETGSLAIVLSVKAMLVNYIYNYFFDRFDVKNGRIPTERSTKWRVIHATGFELILTCTSLPLFMWWLGISFWPALMMDISMVLFVLVFTFCYTLAYDKIFPLLQPGAETAAA
ncbi:PACE efflux transporter [Marinobacterium jannaschii]|uniref:PACE efflux transporter n=1 Tax=Marinobacterium jannaschii TaxID=64970 RepID=UPI0004859E52|nr:PACE efflux transporter [Marinobacterium jannaschii]